MSISNGQNANETNFNNAFASKSAENTLAGKQNLQNADAASGSNVTNQQREHNGVASFTGRTLNGAKDQLPSWTDNSVGLSTNNLKDRAEALTTYAKALSDNKVTGPSSATDNAVVRYDATTGKIVQDSGVIISDTNNITGVNDLTVGNNLVVTGDLTVNGTTTTINTTTMEIEDPNIILNNGGNQAAADDVAGITIEMSDATHAKIIYDKDATSKFRVGEAASEKEIVTISDAQELTNKKYNGGTATAGNALRMIVPKATTAVLNTIVGTEGNLFYSTDEAKYYGDDGANLIDLGSGGGGAGGINYITNNGAETNTTGWATYADAAATSPVNGVGGSPTITWTRSTTSPLRDTASFLFTKDAANRQGEGVSIDFDIDLADVTKVLQVSFDYTIVSGTYADDDVSIWLYDTDNSVLIQPAPYKLKNHNAYANLSGERFFCEFQVPITNSLRLIIHQASTSASAYVLKFDNFSVGPQAKLYGSPITDWVSYTPTGSWVSNTTYAGMWRRVGDSAEIRVRISLTGAPTATSLTVNYPSGLSIDTTKLLSSATDGSVAIGTGATVVGTLYDLAVYSNGSNMAPVAKGSGGTYTTETNVTQLIPATYGSGHSIDFTVKVPILGWSSSVVMSSDADTRVVAARYTTTTAGSYPTSSTTLIDFGTKTFDTHNAVTTGASWKFTAPSAGYYELNVTILIAGMAGWAAGEFANLQIFKNGSSYSIPAYSGQPAAHSTDVALQCSEIIYLLAGEYLDVRLGHNNGSTAALYTGAGYNNIYITKLSGPAQIAASELVEAHYNTAAGQSIPNSTTTIIDYGTKVTDSHGAVTTGASWKFTAPRSGTYSIKAMILYTTGGAWAAAEYFDLALYKNGVLVEYLAFVAMQAAHSTYASASGSTDIKLIAGDYIDIRTSQVVGASLALHVTGLYNYVSITSR